MPSWWPDLAGSWIFYTVLPPLPGPPPRFGRIARFAPLVGLVLGGGQAGLWLLGTALGLPAASLAALVLALGVWITGGLHLDGVIDTADGLAAGPRRLEAMADSRIGASGLMGALLVLLLKGGALIALAPLAPAALVWSAVWGRVAPLLAIDRFPSLRPEGSGDHHRRRRHSLGRELLPAMALLGWLAGLALGTGGGAGLAAGLAGAVPCLLVPWQLGRRLGGHSGDSYGACVEWTEAFSLWLMWLVQLRWG